jgi:hypothetical protein
LVVVSGLTFVMTARPKTLRRHCLLREQLSEDFQFTKTRKAVAECILNAAVFGTGIGELGPRRSQGDEASHPAYDGWGDASCRC